MSNAAAVALSSAIVLVASSILVAGGVMAARGDSEILAVVGGFLGVVALVIWLSAVNKLQRR